MKTQFASGRTLPRARAKPTPKGRRVAPRAVAEATAQPLPERTKQALKRCEEAQGGGAGAGNTERALRAADAAWARMKSDAEVTVEPFAWRRGGDVEPNTEVYDVAICGGTLGVFLAASLQKKGCKVALVERMQVVGRDQEWNISRTELQELVHCGVLGNKQVEDAIAIEFNPVRCAFHGTGQETLIEDVLNLGVSPKKLVEAAKQSFEDSGGTVFENTALTGVEVFDNFARLNTGRRNGANGSQDPASEPIHTRLVLDCMGNASPIARQMRNGKKPDGVCLVVGTCARGFQESANKSADFIVTNNDIQGEDAANMPRVQYFWEAFPAGSGPADRTTYMFTYVDADQSRSSLVDMLEDYWKSMPVYQGVELDDLEIQRVLFGCFPTYQDSPLRPGMDRLLQVGDASGIQSPLSFGGFGALTRHLGRLSSAVVEALKADCLQKADLGLVSPYLPNLSAVWLFQHAMSVRPSGKLPPSNFINKLLGTNFRVMEKLGDGVLRPFNQDVVQFVPLTLTLGGMMVAEPLFIPVLLSQLGVKPIAQWFVHYVSLALYTILYVTVGPVFSLVGKTSKSATLRFRTRRLLDALKFGSGLDYKA